jgi:4-amino-4-deoxy-L-arabinose transferase-like glycosyltransferase
MSVSPPPTSPLTRSANDSRLWLSPRGIILLTIFTLAARWFFAAWRQLVPDETYYWVWSRHLNWSYVDHPPMVAYFIRLGTAIFGTNEFGVRWLMGLLAVGMVVILIGLYRQCGGTPKATGFIAAALLLSPMVGILGSIATPDTPACFFQTAALACAVLIFAPSETPKNHPLLWLGFGLFLGLAMDSKYTSVLLGLSLLLALPWTPQGRRHLASPWPWLAALLAIAVFSPVIFWNAQRHWISFKFQLHHGLSSNEFSTLNLFADLGDYLASQLAVATPVYFVLCVFVLGVYWFRRGLTMQRRILLLAATVPLVFFAASALHKRGNGNWPIFAYFPATLLVADYLSENWAGRRNWWAQVSVKVALVALVLIHFPELFMAINPRLGNPQWDRLFGWRELAANVDAVRGNSPVYATDYEYASELSFYLPGHPMVWPLPIEPTRPTAFDDIPGYIAPQLFDRAVLVRRLHDDMKDVGDELLQIPPWANQLPGGQTSYFPHLEHYPFQSVKLRRTIRLSMTTVASK